jgi:tetratricopeptide (TPR) repeat protein
VFAIGVCFSHFQEYEKAADFYLQAAGLVKGDDALDYLVSAARALDKAKKTRRGMKLLLDACRAGASRMSVRKELYALLKEDVDFYKAFAVGERTLFEDPADNDFRFSLAYDYGNKQINELSLFHYRILSENDAAEKMVLNNLGVSYSLLDFPILAVDSYREAYKNGNTLAADNLARRYLDSGFVSDAAAIIKEAMAHENYEPRLPGTLAATDDNRRKEEERVKTSLGEAGKRRAFLLALGEAFLQNAIPLDGTWKFPEVAISLTVSGGSLKGEAQLVVDLPASVLGVLPVPRESRQEKRRVKFSGRVDGRTCKFRMETEVFEVFSTYGESVREGYIVFSADGKSGQVCELKDGTLSDTYPITKVP